jgi:hypothetical protein
MSVEESRKQLLRKAISLAYEGHKIIILGKARAIDVLEPMLESLSNPFLEERVDGAYMAIKGDWRKGGVLLVTSSSVYRRANKGYRLMFDPEWTGTRDYKGFDVLE